MKATRDATQRAALNFAMKKFSATDYNNLTQGQKLKVFDEISSLTWKTILYDLNEDVKTNSWEMFLVTPTQFGNGYRNITLGFATAEDFSANPDDRFPKTRNIIQDYESVITDLAQLRIRVTENRAETTFYFKDVEGLNRYLEITKKRVKDTMNLIFQDAMLRLFGDVTHTIRELDTKSNFITIIDNIKASFKKETKLKASDLKGKVNQVLKFVENVTSLTSSNFNIGDDGTDTFRKAYNSVKHDDLVLIMSNSLYTDWLTELQASTYNNEFLKWPNIKILKLNIPADTMYIIDKNCFQISHNRIENYSDFYPNTLDTDIFSHNWFYLGSYKNAFGTKIIFAADGTDANDLIY